MKQTQRIIHRTFTEHKPALAFSGGGDSLVLLDIVHALGYRPPLIFADSQMEYPENIDFVHQMAGRYGLPLHIARHHETPQQVWKKHGFPMLGKQSAREWMQSHKGRDFGFKLDVSTCCRKFKIKPARDKTKAIGCDCQLTGQRGAPDDRLRGMRSHLDGATKYLKKDKLTVCNPLTGWTDSMIRRYTRNHSLPVNPLKKQGCLTIGCKYCGGGAQFDNSGFRVLRHTDPTAWRTMIRDYGFGEIILAVKYDRPLDDIRAAIDRLGGIDTLM